MNRTGAPASFQQPRNKRRGKPVEPKSAFSLLHSNNTEKILIADSVPLALGITSLSGAAGTGKTQVCLSLLADCAEKQQPCVYISIGSDDSSTVAKRLYDILSERLPHNNTERIKQDHLSKIYLNWVRNTDDLLEMVQQSLPRLLTSLQTGGILILDGIATLFRGNSYQGTHMDRASRLFQIARHCKALSDNYKLPVVITNQATTKIDTNQLEPALGLSWAQCSNTSLFLSKNSSSKRILTGIKAPHMPSQQVHCEFTIDKRGIIK